MSDLLGLNESRPSSGEYDNVVSNEPDPATVARARSGASWFYWIAALSAVNSIAFLFGANFHFLAGLGFSEIADTIAAVSIEEGAPAALKAVAIVFDVFVFGGFALAGYWANKMVMPVFMIGIVVYAIDAVIVLLLGDFFMAAFHAFALYQLIRGFLACRELKAFHKAAAPALTPA